MSNHWMAKLKTPLQTYNSWWPHGDLARFLNIGFIKLLMMLVYLMFLYIWELILNKKSRENADSYKWECVFTVFSQLNPLWSAYFGAIYILYPPCDHLGYLPTFLFFKANQWLINSRGGGSCDKPDNFQGFRRGRAKVLERNFWKAP